MEAAHVAPHDRFADRLCIGNVVLVHPHVRLDELRCHQLDGMSHGSELSCPVMRAATRFHSNHTGWQLDEEFQYLRSIQLFAHRFPVIIHTVNLKNVFARLMPMVIVLMAGAPYV